MQNAQRNGTATVQNAETQKNSQNPLDSGTATVLNCDHPKRHGNRAKHHSRPAGQEENDMKKYFIGQGTGTVAEFDTLEEMLAFHANMEPLDRHFCRLYDYENHRTAEGWDIRFHGETAWQPW